MVKLEYSELAILDLDDIWTYAAKRGLENADRLTSSLQEAIKLLADFPEMGRERNEWQEGLRALSQNHYLIIYRIIEESVVIERVIHGSRDIEGLFRDE